MPANAAARTPPERRTSSGAKWRGSNPVTIAITRGAITARAPSGSAAAIHTPGRRAARAPRWWRSHSTHTIAANGSRP